MSQSVWGYWLIALGIGVITIMMLVQNYTTINQEDYYLLKEVTQAAMNDAIDYNHYRQYGELKINREKFIENFERRFAESVKGNKNYQTDFYEIYETPPKVSVKVSTKTSSFQVSGDTMDLDVTNSIDAILENNSTNTVTDIFYSMPFYACPEEEQDYFGYCKVTNSATLNEAGILTAIINKLENYGITGVSAEKIEILSSKYIGPMEHKDFTEYYRRYYDTYGKDYNTIEGRSPKLEHTQLSSRGITSYDQLKANDIREVNLTVTGNNVLAWSAKYKCEEPQGFPEGTCDLKANSDECVSGGNIGGQCLIGIKYELKFSYSY